MASFKEVAKWKADIRTVHTGLKLPSVGESDRVDALATAGARDASGAVLPGGHPPQLGCLDFDV